jgi:hypothetical protein
MILNTNRGCVCLLGMLLLISRVCSLPAGMAQAPSPISLTGYNLDIVTDANKAVRFATPLDIGTADWFEKGAVDDNGFVRNDGLPAGNFTSAFTNSVTGGHTAFQFQPFNGNNALLMRYPSSNTGSLSLATPRAYNSLAILAAAYNSAAAGMGTVVINFTDGSHSAPLSYNAFDWGFGPSNVAIGGLGRNFDSGNGTAFNYNQPVPFGLFETDLNLAALGLNVTPISSLTFTGGIVSDQPGVPNHGPSTSIFAVSGSSVPEPSSVIRAALGLAGLVARVWRRRKR